MFPHFQKSPCRIPYARLVFLCLKLVNNISILYYNYLEPNDFCCHYHDPINSVLAKIRESVRKKPCSVSIHIHLTTILNRTGMININTTDHFTSFVV